MHTNTKITTLLTLLLLPLLHTTTTTAATPPKLKPITLNTALTHINQQNSPDLYVATLQPGFQFGKLHTTLDINLNIDTKGNLHDDGNDSIVLSSITYNTNRLKAHYGEIQNYTLGRGFIVSNYRTNIKSNITLNRQQGGTIDINAPRASLRLFGTRSDLYGLRATRTIGRFTAGTTFVAATEPNFDEYAIDLAAAIIPQKLTVYSETAKIQDYGDGFLLGAESAVNNTYNLRFEFRNYDSNFIPSIVDEHYEILSPTTRLASYTGGRKWGWYSAANILQGKKNNLSISFEDYQNTSARASITANAQPFKKIGASLFFASDCFAPNNSTADNNIARAALTYNYNKHLDITIDYYDAYDDTKKPLESLSLKLKLKLR